MISNRRREEKREEGSLSHRKGVGADRGREGGKRDERTRKCKSAAKREGRRKNRR